MAEVGSLEVKLSLRDDMTVALERAIASLKRLADEADKAATRADQAFKQKAKAADDSALATEKDTKAAQENARAAETESKAAAQATAATEAKAKAAQGSAQASGMEAKAAAETAAAVGGEAKAAEGAAQAAGDKAKAVMESAQAAGMDTKAATSNAQASATAAASAETAAKATGDKAKASTADAAASNASEKASAGAAAGHQQQGNSAQDAHQKLQQLQGGLQQTAMQLGVMSAALLYGAKTSIDTFNELRSASMGLTTVAQRTGQDVGKVNEAAKTLSSDGLMTLQESSTSLKNLLATGFNLDQATKLIDTFRDSAAFGRQSSLQFGEAVQTATEGVKNGNSILVDNAGITKNLSVILREAGKSEQDLQNVQSNSSVRMALYNGILKEGALFQGDAARAAGELSGKMSATAASTTQLQATVGEALAPALSGLLDMIRPLINGLGEWVKANPNLARGLGIMAIAVTAVGAAITGLVAAAVGLMTMLGPAGWLVLGISLVVGALTGMAIETKAAQVAQEQHDRQVAALSTRYDQLTKAIDGGRLSSSDRKRAEEELKGVITQIGEVMPGIVTKWDAEGKAISIGTALLNENTAAAIENLRVKSQSDAFGAARDEASARDQLNSFLDSKGKPMTDATAEQLAVSKYGMFQYSLAEPGLQEYFKEQVRADQGGEEAKREGELRKNLASAASKTDQTSALAGKWTPDERARGNYFGNRPSGTPLFPPTITGSDSSTGKQGSNEMSAGLKANLEDLQDIQALEHTPDNLKRILSKTRGIIADHYDELAKLDKLRDMQRTAVITLPNEIAQAEYNAALTQLDGDKTLKKLSPEAFAAQLRGIKDKFAEYLTAHPDQALQMDLRLKGASDEELKVPLDRWKEALRTAEQVGGFDGTGGQDIKRLFLKRGLSLAIGANDQQSVAELTGQIKQIEKALSDANFSEKFDRIKKSREDAFNGAAGALAELQKQLITEEAKGDKSNPVRASQLKEEMLNILTPALEDEQSALEALRTAVLADTTLSEEERAKRVAQIEQSLNSVRKDLYTQDVDVHRIATEAKVSAEKRAADEKKKAEKKLADDRKEAQKDALQELDKAEKKALEEFKNGAKEREDAIQRQIDAKDEQLKQLDRQIAQEDRLQKVHDAQKRVDDLIAHGVKGEVLLADGTKEMRTIGLEEAQKALADAKRDDERARQKETLQDQITNLRDQLQAEKDSNRDKEESLKTHFTAMKDAMQKAFEEMNADQATGLEAMKTSLVGQVDSLLEEWSRYAAEAKRIIESIPPAPDPPAAGGPTTSPSSPSSGGSGGAATTTDHHTRGGHTAFGTGGFVNRPQVAVVGDVPETIVPDTYLRRLAGLIGAMIVPPMIPAGIARAAGGMGAGPQSFAATLQVNVTVPPGTPQHMQQAAYQSAHAGAQAALDAARRGMNERRIGGTKP